MCYQVAKASLQKVLKLDEFQRWTALDVKEVVQDPRHLPFL